MGGKNARGLQQIWIFFMCGGSRVITSTPGAGRSASPTAFRLNPAKGVIGLVLKEASHSRCSQGIVLRRVLTRMQYLGVPLARLRKIAVIEKISCGYWIEFVVLDYWYMADISDWVVPQSIKQVAKKSNQINSAFNMLKSYTFSFQSINLGIF